MDQLTQSLTVTIGPITGHAEGGLAIIALFAIVVLNIAWAAIAARFVHHLARQKSGT